MIHPQVVTWIAFVCLAMAYACCVGAKLVAYKGGGPSLAAVLSGETTVYFTPVATGLPHMRSGKLRALGVTSAKRLSELPDVPAIADTLSGYELLGWAGFTVQAKTPREVVDMLHKAAVAALKRPDVAKRL